MAAPTPRSLCRLFETVSPLLPDLVGRLSADIAPFCSVAGMSFSAGAADAAGGGWRNYFIGLVGSVAADEDDILWPNQVTALSSVLGVMGRTVFVKFSVDHDAHSAAFL